MGRQAPAAGRTLVVTTKISRLGRPRRVYSLVGVGSGFLSKILARVRVVVGVVLVHGSPKFYILKKILFNWKRQLELPMRSKKATTSCRREPRMKLQQHYAQLMPIGLH